MGQFKVALASAASVLTLVLVVPGSTGIATALPVNIAADVKLPLVARAPIILAQSSTDPGGGGDDDDDDDGGAPSGGGGGGDGDGNIRSGGASPGAIANNRTKANPTTTQVIADRLEDIDDNCEKLLRPYRIDCVAQEFRDLAASLPRRGDYGDARAALDKVSRELTQIARANRDRAQPRVRVPVKRAGSTRTKRSGPISAVRESTLPSANQQARQVIERGRATLLRSTSAADPRAVHYQRIAKAFDDSSVLLRS